LGAAAGTIAGAATGASRPRLLVDPLIQGLRSVPSIAWVPLFILWLGIFEASKVALIAVGVFFPVYLNLMSGIAGSTAS
jgi:sulfonate transport system permease protein